MNNSTIKQFRYFEALARHAHFGRAADACSISQPALSMQIKDLEKGLGAPLFDRSARQVRLTGFGADFAKRVRSILHAVDELDDLARSARGGLAGRLRIGVIPTIAPYLLPTLIAALTRENSDLDIQVRETLTSRLIEGLSEGQLDTAIVALPVSEVNLHEEPLFEEHFVLVRPFADMDKPVPDGETLRRMRLLLLEEGHCFRDQALSFCAVRSTLPREGLDGSSLSTLVQLVGSGIGVTLIPEMAIAVETRSSNVAVARFRDPQPSRTIGMVWRKNSPMGKQLTDISLIVKDSAERMRSTAGCG